MSSPVGKAVARSRVLLLGIESQIGLTIIRELARHGVEVHGIARTPHALGAYSRHLHRAYPRAADDAGLVGQLRELTSRLEPCHVMAISENDINLLNGARNALPNTRLLVPDATSMAAVLDKSVTQRVAEEVGIRVPRSVEIATLGELDEHVGDMQFPVVLKWKNPTRVLPALMQAGLELDKVRYCFDLAELRAYLARFERIGEFPLIQEYCPGYGLGQFIFMRQGRAILEFQHRRIHEYPPEGGFSTLCEGLDRSRHADLMVRSVALLQRLRWEGPAMVEYRFDPARDEARLMEINGRFWGSLPLAYYSRAEFAWLTYAILGEGLEAERCAPRSGIRCRAIVTETKRLLRIVCAPGRIQDRTLRFSPLAEIARFFLEFFNPKTRYYVFALDDPMPFFADAFFSVTARLRRS